MMRDYFADEVRHLLRDLPVPEDDRTAQALTRLQEAIELVASEVDVLRER